jgi:hypothetical protein
MHHVGGVGASTAHIKSLALFKTKEKVDESDVHAFQHFKSCGCVTEGCLRHVKEKWPFEGCPEGVLEGGLSCQCLMVSILMCDMYSMASTAVCWTWLYVP